MYFRQEATSYDTVEKNAEVKPLHCHVHAAFSLEVFIQCC
jgi:hypothetical protein